MDKRISLEAMKVVELREICKLSNIIGISGKKKKEIIDLMVDCELKHEFKPLPIVFEELEDDIPIDEPDDEMDFLEEIILHIPKKVVDKNDRWKCFYEKGKKILNK